MRFSLMTAATIPRLLSVANWNIVEVGETQLDVRSFERRWQGFEWIRGADGRERGGIERIFSRGALEIQILGGKAAVAIDAEGDGNDSLIAEIDGFGHDGVPILFHFGDEPIDVAIEIDALGGRQNGYGVSGGRTSTTVAASLTRTSGDATVGAVASVA